MALKDAERQGLVSRSVAEQVRMPRVSRPTRQALTVEQARHLLTVTSPHRLHALFVTTLMLGLRRGEVLGLCWADVDLDPDSPRVFIRHALQRTPDGLVLLPPKTAESQAMLPLPPLLAWTLATHRAAQAVERLAMGARWPGTDYVFTSSTGGPIDPRNLDRQWTRLREKAGLAHLRFHDLRGGCSTLLMSLGVHPRVVMHMLRHTTVAMSMEVYASVAPALERAALDALNEALLG
jgi:integrase